MNKPEYIKTQIFLDSGDPAETKILFEKLGFLDGQTTNPSLVAKNPEIQKLKNDGVLTNESIWVEYNKVANDIKNIIPSGSISVEVYSDDATSFETMCEQGRILSKWFSGIYVKLPITHTGISVAKVLVSEGINVNMTLCFSQDQAAAVHSATKGAKKGQVYVSPFVGRLDDIGIYGLDLIGNILKMYKEWGSHVSVLGASIRSIDHVNYCLKNEAEIITAPLALWIKWEEEGRLLKLPSDLIISVTDKKQIDYLELEQKNWEEYNIKHDLTDKGLEKFATDWKSLFSK